MYVSKKIHGFIAGASWIRKMFEEGTRLRAQHGADSVFDFSLGNPTIEPPESFKDALRRAVLEAPIGAHRYMANTGYPETRAAIAAYLTHVHERPVTENHVVMTVGAAGALNCTLKAILDPGDEVVVWAPFFPEYRFYVDNHQALLVVAETTADFDLDVDELERKMTAQTRAVIVNTPNNPTGRVYHRDRLQRVGEVLAATEKKHGRPIYLLSDEPYRKIVFGMTPPSLFHAHRNSIICTSHSKDLGLPGERIGFAAINPDCEGAAELFGALAFTNRVLGYVNAPALMQRVVAQLQDVFIDPEVYRRKRDLFVSGLRDAGYDVVEPEGAFYLFPRSPIADDVEFVQLLASQLVLTVPGVGFARAGHFRVAFCCGDDTILRSLPHFAEARREALRR
jgi:aspartate aminotransferase